MDTIRQIGQKIKLYCSVYQEELGVSAIIILVAFGSFYLGRASLQGQGRADGVTIDNSAPPASAFVGLEAEGPTRPPTPEAEASWPIVASKNGKRYYYLGCSGISRISPANIVHFASASEAEKFGLTLAANCLPK